MQHFIYPCGRTMRGLKVGAKLNILIHSRNFLSKKNYYNAKKPVRFRLQIFKARKLNY